jgi:hypothetical protein
MVDGQVAVSEHCRLRYTQRAGIDAPPIHVVWKNGIPVEIEYREDVTARLEEDIGVILLMRDDTLITVLQSRYEDFSIKAHDNRAS